MNLGESPQRLGPAAGATQHSHLEAAQLCCEANGGFEALRGRLLYRTPSDEGSIVTGVVMLPKTFSGDVMYEAVMHPGIMPMFGGVHRALDDDEAAAFPSEMIGRSTWPIGRAKGCLAVVVRDTGIPLDGDMKWALVFGVGKLGLDRDFFVDLDGGRGPRYLDANQFQGLQPWQALRSPLWADSDSALVTLLTPGKPPLTSVRANEDPQFDQYRAEMRVRLPWIEGRTYYSAAEHALVESTSREVIGSLIKGEFKSPSQSPTQMQGSSPAP